MSQTKTLLKIGRISVRKTWYNRDCYVPDLSLCFTECDQLHESKGKEIENMLSIDDAVQLTAILQNFIYEYRNNKD